jgi:uncharacterized protein YecE (DUF72 family)
MRLAVGTCGYDYAEWVGEDRFYPPGLAHARADWLTYYASQFPIAELNFTHYGEASPRQLEQMLKRVQPSRTLYLLEGDFTPLSGFQFVIKAYASLTHSVSEDWRAQARKFMEDTAPLRESGTLLGVLAQFPSRAHYNTDLSAYVGALADALAPVTLIVEFRHPRWFDADARERLRQAGVVFCEVDAPAEAKLPSLFDTLPDAVVPEGVGGAPFAYLRLHGRREGAWWRGDAASRYEYRYAQEQLARLAQRLLQSYAERTYVLFNNHRHADAAKNARQLEEIVTALLGKKSLDGSAETGYTKVK